MSNAKPNKKEKRPFIKMYFSLPEAKAIQGAIDLLSAANGEPIKPKDYAKLAVMTYSEAVGSKHADLQAAKKAEELAKDD